MLFRSPFAEFFASLHDRQKALDKAIRAWERSEAQKAEEQNEGRRRPDKDMKALKAAMDTLHADMRDAEQCFAHIEWLQSRFPEARYEDVVGLCKAANKAELEEQDWSLNPGRYVGVVIEEDGKTEEEFISGLEGLQNELDRLESDGKRTFKTIVNNVKALIE